MSQTIITLAFEQWKARQAVSGAPVLLDGFVLANVPGLNPAAPVNRSEGLPPAAQIVHRQDVSQAGVINENAVAYSVTLGADVGDFAFNWIGLINKATNTVAMIVHAPVQQKVKNAAGQQGNVLTRSFVMEYSGAQAETQITTPAETWQIDFTARLGGVDERQRVENVDIYGAAAFFDNGYLVTKSGSSYSIAPGVGYVAGLRTQLGASQPLTVTTKPVKVWLDVCFKGTLTSVWAVETAIKVAASLADYVADGRQHYVFAVASIDAAGTVTDLRPKGSLADQGGASAYARKDRNLSDLDSIPKAREALKLKGAALLDVGAAAGMVAAGDDSRIVNAVPNTRKINGHQLTSDFDLSAEDVKALAVTTLRAGSNPSAGYVADADDLPANAISFVYSNVPNAPDFTGSVLDFSGIGNGYNTQIAAAYASAGARIGFRTRNGDKKTWNPWYEFYHNGNKPSPSDVGALPVNAPELSVNLNTLGHPTNSIGVYVQGYSLSATAANNYPLLEAGTLLVTRSAYGCQQEYTGFSSGRKFVRGLTGAFNGSGPWGPWKEYLLTTANAASASKLATARTIAGVAFDGQGNIAIPAANVGAYTKAEVDSRVNARGAKNTASNGQNGWWRCGDTGRIEQQALSTSVGGQTVRTVNFPIPFPNACLNVVIAWANANSQMDYPVRITSWTKTGVSYVADGGGAVSLQAVGY
ncbi:phage tail protein [Erwinia aphidicola]|uniref:phage tail-collar fiber domain-containing protein n=1 Tax=Erwinia aphidicola TaxID=68334 RepID=UPI0030195566